LKNVVIFLSILIFPLLVNAETALHVQGNYERYFNGQLDANSAFIDLIKIDSNKYRVSGTSSWIGDPSSGLINVGEIGGIVALDGNQIHYDIDGCELLISLEHNALVVSDDNGCGGLNVSFNGRYVKNEQNQ
jgi:hypothetical protein